MVLRKLEAYGLAFGSGFRGSRPNLPATYGLYY